eukprot:TRINITY_DN1212_c0_g4_i1.p1 TRINITY_DN1212_c0_g4~~TRINITY_DN1212_c0_g4_i1.p1  ORF type:complete len:876 (-),score=287.40 TRINITY_DN1212_c0_g4_i1:769-3396(-)
MLEGSLKTGVDTKYFGSNAIIDKVTLNGDRYIYRLRKDKIYYTLKGYRIQLENVNPRSEESRRSMMKAVSGIGEAYQEYFLGRIGSLFSQHFSKPLEIDQQLSFPSNAPPQLFIEILLEHIGEPLEVASFDLAYNLMRQSASALALLQSAGLTQLELSPSNLVYNKTSDLLTIMSNDIEPGYGAFNTVRVAEDEGDLQFLLEGGLRERRVINVPVVRLPMGNIDVYCWAMCFYAILLGKSVGELVEETNVRGLTSEASYNKFMANTRLLLENIPIRELKEKKKKAFVIKLIYEALNLNPRERPSVSELKQRMKEFEKAESIELPYQKTEKEQEEKIIRVLNGEEQVEEPRSVSKASGKKEGLELYMAGDDYSAEKGKEFLYGEAFDYSEEEKKEDQFSIPEFGTGAVGKHKYEIPEYRADDVIAEFAKEGYLGKEKETYAELNKYKLPEYNKEDYDYLLQDLTKGGENYGMPDLGKEKKGKYEVFEYTPEEPLPTDFTKAKFELPDFTKEEDKYLNKELDIPELRPRGSRKEIPELSKYAEGQGKHKAEGGKSKYSDIMKTPEKYEIPDFIKEIGLGGSDDKELPQESAEDKQPLPGKVLYNINKEEERYLDPWNTKEKALHITPGVGKEKGQYANPKISKENEYHDIQGLLHSKEQHEIRKPQHISSSSSKEKPQGKVPFTKEDIISSTHRDKPKHDQEEPMKLPLYKIDEGLPISNLEELLKYSSAVAGAKKEPPKPSEATPRNDSPDDIPKMPIDLSPQNTPSDDIIGYNRPIERSQFSRREENFVESTYVSGKPSIISEPTPVDAETTKKPTPLPELPINNPAPKRVEVKLPEPPKPHQSLIGQPTVIGSRPAVGPLQKPANPLSKRLMKR